MRRPLRDSTAAARASVAAYVPSPSPSPSPCGLTCFPTDADGSARPRRRWWWSATAFWKFNSGFMAPATSCAPIYLVQLADQFLPRSVLRDAPFLVTMLVDASPTMVLLVEAAAPLLLWLAPLAGIVFAALFHFLIAITVRTDGTAPPPPPPPERAN